MFPIQEHVEQRAALERQMQQLNERHATNLAEQQRSFNAKRQLFSYHFCQEILRSVMFVSWVVGWLVNILVVG